MQEHVQKRVQDNHLIEPIQALLESAESAFSEYELIQALQSQGWIDPLPVGDTLGLYGVHFLVYNALFQLHQKYLKVGKYLMISALSIQLQEAGESSGDQELSSQTELVELQNYYLDWSQLDSATQESVNDLLSNFWEYIFNDDDYMDALQVFKAEVGTPYDVLKQRYRQLAMKYHPDRGGDVEHFQNIQRAFAVLQRRFRRKAT